MPIFARRAAAALGERPRRRVRRPPALTRHEIEVPGLPAKLDGLTVAHLSDVHVQRMAPPRHLDRAVALVNELRPDLTFLTGDYVCFHPGAIPRLRRSLARLEVPHAPLAVLGNHDHWCDGPAIRRTMEELGIVVLQNEHAVARPRGETVVVVGVDDARTGRDDPARAFDGAPDGFRVALTHDPRGALGIAPYRPGLILAGHTHGGQIHLGRMTDRLAARLGHHHLAGFFELGGSRLFVNRGLGASVPLRVNAPSEVAVLVLRSAVAGNR